MHNRDFVKALQGLGITEKQIATFQRLKQQGRVETLTRQAAQESLALLRGEYVPQTAHRRLHFPITSTPKAQRPLCGAKTRQGTPCKAKVVDGTARCRMHGGLSTGPTTEAGRKAIAESNTRRAKELRC